MWAMQSGRLAGIGCVVLLGLALLVGAAMPGAPAWAQGEAPEGKPLYVALIWHQHQPYYEDPARGVYMLPWVRMHAVKDYYDMVAMLRQYPGMRATFNLVPSLLMQLDDYVEHGAKDLHQMATEKPAGDLTAEDKAFILRRFFDANHDHIIGRFPRYRELFEKRGTTGSDAEIERAVVGFSEQDFRDLQVWFNLGWMDPDFLEQDPDLARLVAKGRDFTEADKHVVLAKHLEIMRQVVAIHRELMEAGQIEVITAPFFHPILPLVYDTGSARVASPSIRLPQSRYVQPGDVRAQLAMAVTSYREHFGREPKGLWPSEQAVGQDIVAFAAGAGFQWMVSSEGVLEKSLGLQLRGAARELVRPADLYQPYWVTAGGQRVAILFRDIVLSDRIGFSYSGMPAERAVDDFIGYLHEMRRALAGVPGEHVVTVALDGENAWEWYDNDGKDFLHGLYRRLTTDPLLRPVTVAEYLESHPPSRTIPRLWTGSWISDNLETWIGEEEENRAWDYLHAARTAIVRHEALHYGEPGVQERVQVALQEVYAAEGSDWFWWYGSDQDSGNDAGFDELFRTHLRNVYTALGEPVPDTLHLPIIPRAPARPEMQATGRLTARADGTAGAGEWADALRFGGDGLVQALYVGNDAGKVYVRAELDVRAGQLRQAGIVLRFYLSHPRQMALNTLPRESPAGERAVGLGFGLAQELTVDLTSFPPRVSVASAQGEGRWGEGEVLPDGSAAVGLGKGGRSVVVELAVPFGVLDLQAAESASLALVAVRQGEIAQVVPAAGPVRIQVPEVIRGDLVFEREDPAGDDYGPGAYVYPGNAVFTPGVFDMRRFQVFREGNDVVFKVSLEGAIDNVWNSPIGLSVQTIDIYVDTDRQPGSGKTEALGGRRVRFAPESAWERAIWIEGWNQRIFTADGSEPEGASRLRVTTDAAERSVTVRVPVSAIGEPQPTWGYQVFVLGQEGYPEGDSLRVREVKTHQAEWRFGGGDDDVWDPNVIDLLAPEGVTQEAILGAYSILQERLAEVPMVVGP